MMKNNTGVVQTLPKRDLIELNTQITAQRLMQNGIDPNSLKNANQVENAVNAIESRPPVQEGIRSTKSAKVFDIDGNPIDPSKGIIGGKQMKPIKQGEAITSENFGSSQFAPDNQYGFGRNRKIDKTTNQKPKSLKKRESEILAAMEKNNKETVDRIRKRKEREDLEKQFNKDVEEAGGMEEFLNKNPIDDDTGDFAQGGRAGYAYGGITALKALLNFFAKQRGTKGSQQLKDINPKSVPSGIMNIMGPEHRKMLERNQTDYLESLLNTIKSDKKFLDKNKEIAKQVQKDIDEAGFGDFTTAEEMLQPFIKNAMKGDRLDRMKVYDKINIDDAIMDIEQMIKNRRMRESDGRALNATGGRAGFKDGPDEPGRRKFMKIMGGVASLPFLGKFVKPAMPLIQKGAELTGPALDKIIEVVMSAGKLVSQSGRKLKELTTKKKLKDIEVEEDMMDGPSYTIKTKDKTIYYKPGKQDEMGIEDDIIEVIEDTVTKKASGGVARMLGE